MKVIHIYEDRSKVLDKKVRMGFENRRFHAQTSQVVLKAILSIGYLSDILD